MEFVIMDHQDDNGCLFYDQLMHKKIFDWDKIPVD
jgi:hypothetical protein